MEGCTRLCAHLRDGVHDNHVSQRSHDELHTHHHDTNHDHTGVRNRHTDMVNTTRELELAYAEGLTSSSAEAGALDSNLQERGWNKVSWK